VLFLIADAGLVWLALHAGTPKADVAEVVETPAPVEPQPTETAAPVEVTPLVPVVSSRVLTALDGSHAWRAVTGACPQVSASIEITEDSGATWSTSDVTGITSTVAVQRIELSSPDVASVVTLAAEDCTPRVVRTFVGGEDYAEYPAAVAATWFVQPQSRAVIHSPTGDVAAPCALVTELAVTDDDNAAVLCADGTVHLTFDGGATWPAAMPAPGAMSIAAGSQGYLTAEIGVDGCAGVQVSAIDAAGTARVGRGCLATAAAPETLVGNVAVSQGEDVVWLWAGDVLARSTDGGASW
jgi:hypothetical protein